jgi:hypothetical protein
MCSVYYIPPQFHRLFLHRSVPRFGMNFPERGTWHRSSFHVSKGGGGAPLLHVGREHAEAAAARSGMWVAQGDRRRPDLSVQAAGSGSGEERACGKRRTTRGARKDGGGRAPLLHVGREHAEVARFGPWVAQSGRRRPDLVVQAAGSDGGLSGGR